MYYEINNISVLREVLRDLLQDVQDATLCDRNYFMKLD